MLIQAFITFEASNLIAFDQLCFEALHVDKEGIAIFKVIIDYHYPITGVWRTGEIMIVL